MKVKGKILALIIVIIVISILFLRQNRNDLLSLYVCDVGQGDGVVLKSPEGKIVVIDGGPDRKILDCLESLSPFKVYEIETMILTHPHKDHISGLLEIMDRYRIKQLYLSYDLGYENSEYKVFREKLEGMNVRFVTAGDTVDVDKGLRLDFVWPEEGYTTKNINNVSVVTRISYGQSCFLETGDAGADFEDYYIENYGECQVLKVGHHGSKFSTGSRFLSVVKPEMAIISSGENTYGHPNKDVINRLDTAGAEVFRTDEKTVKIVSDGTEWYIAGN